jgi:hypothetical protein
MAFVRLILGPIGSGKSVACIVEILRCALQMPMDKSGIRPSRWLVVRNTYGELKDTTIRTFFEWIPQELGYWNKQELRFVMQFAPGDGSTVELEVLFRALDKPQDVRKLLSLELTGAFINEAKEVPRAVLNMLLGRVGRFPTRDRVEDYRYCVIMDTNPPDVDHYIHKTFVEKLPQGWAFFHQPSGLSPEAENRKNLPKTYYEQLSVGQTAEWVKVFVHGKFGFVSDGKPVYAEFNDDVHVSKQVIEPVEDEPLIIGLDFGLTPAASINQFINGQLRCIDELVSEEMGAIRFGEALGIHLRNKYSGYLMEIWGDPAGSERVQTDEQTPFMVLAALGIFAQPAPTNDWEIRRETVASLMMRMTFNGQPAFIVSPNCHYTRKGYGGGYKLRRVQVVGDERFKDVPDKTMYSHVCEAGQYAAMGAGLGYELLGYTKDWDKSVNRAYN